MTCASCLHQVFFDDTSDARAIKILQMCATLPICIPLFLLWKTLRLQNFGHKLLHIANYNLPFSFNGARIKVTSKGIITNASSYVSRLNAVVTYPFISNEYEAQRTRGIFNSSICRLYLYFAYFRAAQNIQILPQNNSRL